MEPNKDNRTGLQKKVAALSERAWKIVQCAGGIGLGCAVCFFLYGDSMNSTTYSIYALLLALVVPRLVEQSCGRSVASGRVAMLITIVLLVVGHLLLTYAIGPAA